MRTTIAAMACVTALLGGCGSAEDSGSSASGGPARISEASGSGTGGSATPSSAPATAPATTRTAIPSAAAQLGAVITVASSRFGPVLFDGSGQAIYLFDAETSGKPNCYEDCAAVWPPVLTTGRPVARGGVEAELLGVTTRRDGSSQVTYGGKPLYFYAHEGKHVVLCHNIREFGGLWLAITKTGSPAPT